MFVAGNSKIAKKTRINLLETVISISVAVNFSFDMPQGSHSGPIVF